MPEREKVRIASECGRLRSTRSLQLNFAGQSRTVVRRKGAVHISTIAARVICAFCIVHKFKVIASHRKMSYEVQNAYCTPPPGEQRPDLHAVSLLHCKQQHAIAPKGKRTMKNATAANSAHLI
jgi:hypothetical protein